MSMASLICAMKGLFNWIVENLFTVLDLILSTLLAILPSSPFDFSKRLEWGEFGQLVGYFFPIADMMTSFSLILVTIALYYGIRHLLRIVRAVKG
jgi:hypothetical protein